MGTRARGRTGKRTKRLAVATVAVLLLAGACGETETHGGSTASDDAAPTTTTTGPTTTTSTGPTTTTSTAPTTTTSAPAGGRVPSAEDPLRVLLAGDSVMAGLAPALTAALESGGAADATFTLSPSLPRQDLDWAGWQARLAEVDPEVVVVLVGVWERTYVPIAGDPAWRTGYDAAVRDPFAQMVTESGARLVWVGMPAVPDTGLSLEFAALNQAFQQQADASPQDQVAYVDGPAAIAAPDGTHPPVIPRPGGRLARVRQVDGTHLCADGATLIARSVVTSLQQDWQVPVAQAWSVGDWRTTVGTPAQCPAP